MKSDEFPLFTDFNTYEKWLPVRQIDMLKLYQLPHYTNENDLMKKYHECIRIYITKQLLTIDQKVLNKSARANLYLRE